MKKPVYIGTSGYTYAHWQGIFYPRDTPQTEWLDFYARYFNAVELNVTFYRILPEQTFKNWYNQTPQAFRFIIKGSRFITHIKKLKDVQESLEVFFKPAAGLKEKLLGVLWQFPPLFQYDLSRLNEFIQLLKKNYGNYLHSFEFRNDSWFNRETFLCLRKNNINLCIADAPHAPGAEEITSSFVYLRFHGGKTLYQSEYSQQELSAWTKKIQAWSKDTDIVFAFFNNDSQGHAVKNALILKKKLYENI